jgi:hypothetical protein
MQFRKYFAALLAALLFTGASAANAALTPIDVTWNPSAAGITTQGAFTFDNVLINTYANIDINAAGTAFTESGFLRMSVFSNNGLPTSIPTAGFPAGTPYSLYMTFTATGTQTAGVPSTGSFTSLTYQLRGAPGVTTFADSNNDGIFEVTGAPTIQLASGALLSPGSTSLTLDPGTGLLLPAAQVFASFIPNTAFAGFFVNPNAFTALDVNAAFTNTGSVITQFAGPNGGTRLSLNGGGGNATFAITAVPEPDTYGMLLAGLGLFAFIARRKSNRYTA